MSAHRAEERGVAEGEDPAVGGHQPVALAARGGGHAHDGPRQVDLLRVPVEGTVAVGEDLAEGGDHGIAHGVGGGGHANHLALGGRRIARRRRWCGHCRVAWCVHLCRGVVGGRRRGAGRVDLPGRYARHDPALDAPEAGDVLVALPVAELEAARRPIVAVAERALTGETVARGIAERPSVAAPGGAAADGVAVHVVAGSTAEGGAVGLPPPADDGSFRAPVVAPVDGAAELGVAVTTGRTTAAAGVGTPADVAVGGGGSEGKIDPAHGEGRAHEGGAHQDAAPGQAPLHGPGQALDQRRVHAPIALRVARASPAAAVPDSWTRSRRAACTRPSGPMTSRASHAMAVPSARSTTPSTGWATSTPPVVRSGKRPNATRAAAVPNMTSTATCRPVAGVSARPKHPQLATGPPRARMLSTTRLKAP